MSIDHPCGGKRQLTARAAEVFGKPAETALPAVDLQVWYAEIGQLTLENDFLEGAFNQLRLLSAKR